MRTEAFMGSVALLLLFLAAVASKPTVDVGINLTPGLDSLFNSIDTNHDGELTVNEAEEFIRSGIGGADYDDNKEVHAAAMDMLSKLDSADIGSTVSPKELDHQLHAVLSGTRVADWVQHGLGLPQYAEQFRAHAVTPLDFPILIADGGRVLSTEFQVASKYHKEKILRAMKRQMLSLGSVPSSVQALQCQRTPSGAWRLSWEAPKQLGQPAMHKYLVEKPGADNRWQLVSELDDTTMHTISLDVSRNGNSTAALPASQGHDVMQPRMAAAPLNTCAVGLDAAALYRITAWNLYGRSPVVTVTCGLGEEEVAAPGQLLCPTPKSASPATQAADRGAAAAVVVAAAAAVAAQGAPRSSPAASQDASAWSYQHATVPEAVHAQGRNAAAEEVAGAGGAASRWYSMLLLALPWLLRFMPSSTLMVIHRLLALLLQRVLAGLSAIGIHVHLGQPGVSHAAAAAAARGGGAAALNASGFAHRSLMPGSGMHSATGASYPGAVPVGGAALLHGMLPGSGHVPAAGQPAAGGATCAGMPVLTPGMVTPKAIGMCPGQHMKRFESKGCLHHAAMVSALGGSSQAVLSHLGMPSSARTIPQQGAGYGLGAGCDPWVSSQQAAAAAGVLDSMQHAAGMAAGGSGMLGTSPGGSAAAAANAWSPSAATSFAKRPPPGVSKGSLCAHDGCNKIIDSLLHYKDWRTKHYCGRCQRMLCAAHTAYSPHGATGSCGQESKCVCIACFTHFSAAYQAHLRERNTLPNPPLAAAMGASASQCQGPSANQQVVQYGGGGGSGIAHSNSGSLAGQVPVPTPVPVSSRQGHVAVSSPRTLAQHAHATTLKRVGNSCDCLDPSIRGGGLGHCLSGVTEVTESTSMHGCSQGKLHRRSGSIHRSSRVSSGVALEQLAGGRVSEGNHSTGGGVGSERSLSGRKAASAKAMWGKALRKMKAVVRFKQGAHRHDSTEAGVYEEGHEGCCRDGKH